MWSRTVTSFISASMSEAVEPIDAYGRSRYILAPRMAR
jgi:hypothetical protein